MNVGIEDNYFIVYFQDFYVMSTLRHERIFRHRLKTLDTYVDVEFNTLYRITRPMFLGLHGNIGSLSSRYTSQFYFGDNPINHHSSVSSYL